MRVSITGHTGPVSLSGILGIYAQCPPSEQLLTSETLVPFARRTDLSLFSIQKLGVPKGAAIGESSFSTSSVATLVWLSGPFECRAATLCGASYIEVTTRDRKQSMRYTPTNMNGLAIHASLLH